MYILCKCWITLLFILCSFILTVNTYKAEQIIRRGPGQDPQCADPLINSIDTFPDTSFSSSSVWKNATDFQPFRARLTEVYGSSEHTSGYAWCPNTHVEDGLREWIQAEFSHLVIISVIFTAGRGDGNVKEYMPNFVLRYQREDNGVWYEHVKSDGTRVLKANNDPRNIARTTLDSVVIAKRIRIYPYSHRSKQQVCLRFALYGCDFPDGVISYSMPQGDIVTYGRQLFGSPYSIPQSFQDLTYDGQLIESENQLIGGIGQLMDNVAYLGNVSQHSDSHPTQPGFHFIGWHIPSKDLRILFKFDEVRNFIWLRIFTFDSVPLKSRVFSRAHVEFSMDGKTFDKSIEILTNHARVVDPNQINPTRLSSISDDIQSSTRLKRTSNSFIQDTIIYNNHEWDGALVVQIPLASYTARYVSLTLTSSDSWILLSEVQFNSTIVQPNSMLLSSNTRENNKPLKKSLDNNSNYLQNSQKL
ncbi:Discoidin domain-containing receptor 2, partial [Schistosoma japonicum]